MTILPQISSENEPDFPAWPSERAAQVVPLEEFIRTLGKLPGLGPRSARRVALHLLKKREAVMAPLIARMEQVMAQVKTCTTCGNLDVVTPCHLCINPKRDNGLLCVVEDVDDLWALERADAYRGKYHVLGGVLSALNGQGPEQLHIESLLARVRAGGVREVILALGASVEGQTTCHYLAQMLGQEGVTVTRLAQGMPMGGELDYLDDGTLLAALNARAVI